MLDELHIVNLALIKDVSIEFKPGFTVLTGETGAGKSMVLSALSLLLGARADSTLVSEGEPHALIEGRFFNQNEELIVSRRVGADGRSRCNLNGSMSTVTNLAKEVGPLVDLVGQHEHQRLLSSANHLGMLDLWAGDRLQKVLVAYQEALREAQQAEDNLTSIESSQEEQGFKLDEARHIVATIEAVDPSEHEYEELLHRMPALEHAETLAQATEGAHQALAGEDGVSERIHAAQQFLESAARIDSSLTPYVDELRSVSPVIQDLIFDLRSYADDIEFNPQALDEANQRIAELSRLMRLYGPEMSDVLQQLETSKDLISRVDDRELYIKEAKQAVEKTEAILVEKAQTLHEIRANFAKEFTNKVNDIMKDLDMPHSTLSLEMKPLQRSRWTYEGPDSVQFMYSPAETIEAKPLTKIASGGEVSRVMFAILSVMGESDQVDTIVFDEIDAGVGGRAAHAIGERMKELSRSHQILVVTHLAQIAAYADQHLLIRKSDKKGDVQTQVISLEGEERIDEIARMLSGSDTSISRKHAQELLGVVE